MSVNPEFDARALALSAEVAAATPAALETARAAFHYAHTAKEVWFYRQELDGGGESTATWAALLGATTAYYVAYRAVHALPFPDGITLGRIEAEARVFGDLITNQAAPEERACYVAMTVRLYDSGTDYWVRSAKTARWLARETYDKLLRRWPRLRP